MFGYYTSAPVELPIDKARFDRAFSSAYSLNRNAVEEGAAEALYQAVKDLPFPDEAALSTVLTSAYMTEVFRLAQIDPFVESIQPTLSVAANRTPVWSEPWLHHVIQKTSRRLGCLWLPYRSDDPAARMMFLYPRTIPANGRANLDKITDTLGRYSAFGTIDGVTTFELTARTADPKSGPWKRNLRLEAVDILKSLPAKPEIRSAIRALYSGEEIGQLVYETKAYSIKAALDFTPAYPREPAFWTARLALKRL